MKHGLLVLTLAVAATAMGADAPPVMSSEDAIRQHLLFYYPFPEYPSEARRQSITGSGIRELRFDYESGHLREVHVVTSTGSPLLDSSAIAGLKRWQAKPHSVRGIRVPVTFTRGAPKFRYESPHEHG